MILKALNIKADIGGTYLNIIKALNDKPSAKILLNSEKLKSFFSKIWNKTRMSTLASFTPHSIGSPSHSN